MQILCEKYLCKMILIMSYINGVRQTLDWAEIYIQYNKLLILKMTNTIT